MGISLLGQLSQHLEFIIQGKSLLLDVEDPNEVLVPSKWPIYLIENLKLRNSEREGVALDLGTGSGILAVALHKMGCKNVDASDINPFAVQTVKKNISLNELEGTHQFIRSDVFEKMSKCYDLIVTNPPTFPDVPLLKRNHYIDYAFFAGRNGREFIDKVIENVSKFLVDGGRLVLLHPSYLNTKLTLERLEAKNFQARVVSALKISLDDYGEFLSENGFDAQMMKKKLAENAASLGSELKRSDPESSYEFSLDLIEATKPEIKFYVEGFRP